MPINHELDLAWDFVEKTDRNVFLTGKAGTGKTTFLHHLKQKSFKRLVVVAPTGVAAINAKGVTIHSFFQIAFGPVLPEDAGFNRNESGFQRKFNKAKIDIIKSLDLLIIDEISMVRADLLDGIDKVLKRYKDRTKAFGGVQVLMIGDLQQLAPVVKENEWDLLKNYYESPYFFSSQVFKNCNPINIELKHIYRQDNEFFIGILNEIRHNKLSEKSASFLNERYIEDFVPKKNEGYITLTTHNSRANEMNNFELEKIKSKSVFYNAVVEGNFPEYSFPTQPELELKVGAQVMFIKNDSSPEKRYFNGKIGEVIALNEEEIRVKCLDDDAAISVTPEKWENINYSINPETKEIDEQISGVFSQMPLRLAWAITIHKSQGLTFEKAIIDAEASFAHGQTYVALSRCKTLEGIVLKHPINDESIINDSRVALFNKLIEDNQPNQTILNESQKQFQLNLIEDLFSFYNLLHPINRLLDVYYKNSNSLKGNFIEPLIAIKENGVTKLLKVNSSFLKQLREFAIEFQDFEKNETVYQRIQKGIDYFLNHTHQFIKKPFDSLTFSTENKDLDKEINKHLNVIEEQLDVKITCFNALKNNYSSLKYLELRAKAILQNSKKLTNNKERKTTTAHQHLFDQLKELRTFYADIENVPHYVIFNQKTLFDLCDKLPITKKQLQLINGLGKVRIEKYGDEILDIIEAYCYEHKIETNQPTLNREKVKKKDTKKISFELFKNGLTAQEIAQERSLTIATIEGHLAHFIPTGEVKITDLIPEEKYQELKKLMETTVFDNLTDLKNKIDEKFTYNEMRLVAKTLELNT